jgi:metal-responsive CopG/Arc/MetJ family transcriptional regulator
MMERISIVIDRELLEEINQAARRRGISRSEFMREAVRYYVKKATMEERAARERRLHRD